MKRLLFLLTIAFLPLFCATQNASEAGIIANQKAKIEHNRIYKATKNEIKSVILKQDEYANKQDLEKLLSLYSEDFLNSDGFNKKSYTELIKETWQAYPDITYHTEIRNIEFTDNYATVIADEIAVATSKEEFGGYEAVGELFSNSKCVYHLEKRGNNWLIISERIIEENTSLKFGDARYINMELNAPKEIGTNTYYTATLKVDTPKDTTTVGSITREKIVYPQTKSDDAFRRIYDGTLERLFKSNSDNVNEYAVAAVGITHAENYDATRIRVYLSGMAFLMTRINVVPENKFIKIEKEDKK